MATHNHNRLPSQSTIPPHTHTYTLHNIHHQHQHQLHPQHQFLLQQQQQQMQRMQQQQLYVQQQQQQQYYPHCQQQQHQQPQQQLQQQLQQYQPQPIDTTPATIGHLPTNAKAGVQYSALSSITSTESILRDLPSLSIAFSDFRLLQPKDATVQNMLAQQGLTQHAFNFQAEYLKTIISNANVDDIRFMSATQITSSNVPFIPNYDQPLSGLSQSVLDYCTKSRPPTIQPEGDYQLPIIDPYNALIELRDSAASLQQSTVLRPQQPSVALENRRGSVEVRESSPPAATSQKRGAQDATDDELDMRARAPKKLKARPTPAAPSIKFDPTYSAASSSDNKNPTPEFEDTVGEFLESIESADENNDIRKHLSGSQLKHLDRSVQDLSKQGQLIEVQIDTLSTLLKYLESSMNEFDTIDVISLFSEEFATVGVDCYSVIDRLFDRITLSLEHVVLSLSILNARGLQQHLFPEELLVASLSVFKTHVEKFLVPALEFSKDDNGLSKGSGIFKAISGNTSLRSRVLSVVGTTCDISERLRRSGNTEVSDDIIVKLVYIGLALFFIDTSSELMVGLTEAESVKQSGSSLLRMIFAKHSKQRTWILEEILSLLIKLPHGKKVTKGYRLIDGSKIHTSSALLMQLVQTCSESPLVVEPPADLLHLHPSTQKIEFRKLWDDVKRIMEGAKTSVGYIFNVLLSRSMKGTKSSVEADYRTVLDTLVTDLLTVLGHPEWPSAELYLLIFSTAMARCLDDTKADSAARTMAVDTLGLIAARIKTISNRITADATEQAMASSNDEQRPFYGDLSINTNTTDLSYLQANYNNVVEYLGSNEMNDTATKAAKNTWIGQWIAVICSATTKEYDDRIWGEDQWNTLTVETLKLWRLFNSQESHPRSILPLARKSVSQSGAYLTSRQQLFLSFDMMLSRILMALEGGAITLRAKSLRALSLIVTGDYAVLSQLNVRRTIALRLQDQSPSVRDAALELVGKYMLQDAAIRKAYYEIDTGLNVRKRVLRLLKDMFHRTDDPEICNDISQKLLLRVHDDETTVKDLAIKSVSEVWFSPFVNASSISHEGRGDHADGSNHVEPVTPSQRRDISKRSRTLIDMVGKLSIPQAEAFGSVIQWLLNKERRADEFNLSNPRQTFSRTCAVIVDCLVDLIQTLQDEDAPKSSVASAVHTLHTFIKAEPRLIEAKHLSTLLVYLHCSSTSEDWKITMFVLRIFQDAIPVVKDMTPNDSQMAEKLALALVAKCPVVLLPEAVHVLCLTVRTLTLHSTRLCKFLQTCVDLLGADVHKLRAGTVVQDNKTRRLMTIVGLLCKHFDFERAIKDNPEESHLAELKAKMQPSPHEYVFAILSSLCVHQYSLTLQQSALQSLGHVYMSFPILMNSSKSVKIMDSIFAGHEFSLQTELLQIYTGFLLKIQTTPMSEQGKGAGYSLVAKVEDHLEAGIGSSIMQRYLDRILKCALVADESLQSAAIDVITQVTLQALVHPMLCMPAIAALETSNDSTVCSRVLRIHRDLHQKHASLIYAKSMECIRTAYTYQMSLRGSKADVHGYKLISETGQSVALICHMYNLVSDKRQPRNTLLSGLVKVLEVDLTSSNVEIDGNYARFIAENLAYLDYKTMEEVLLVIFHLNRIIAGSGMTLLHSLTEMSSRSRVSASDDDSSSKMSNGKAPKRGKRAANQDTTTVVAKPKSKSKKANAQNYVSPEGENAMVSESGGENHHDDAREPILPMRVMARASVAVEAAILLKTCLKRIYDISEFKCHQFQPTSHATHKEKPVLRPTGTVARIHWQWSADQVDTICDPMSTKSNAEDMARNQLGHFLELIEAESVQHMRDDEKESAKGQHHNRHGHGHGQGVSGAHASRNSRQNLAQQQVQDEREEEEEGDEAEAEEGEEDNDEDAESSEDGDDSGEDPNT
ncbi:Sister chromatid cohesion protein 2 [Linnemannia schmuckeri]|uniref:Sister chromatid cohesion protein n=1 Tax=Linnemannia schmuckeri TaxID=64567 RepID=A0A9P5S8N2_9FUNG|nr:Sister chromatid cohesion protein 2 [Linnemannia schmuckeri]